MKQKNIIRTFVLELFIPTSKDVVLNLNKTRFEGLQVQELNVCGDDCYLE